MFRILASAGLLALTALTAPALAQNNSSTVQQAQPSSQSGATASQQRSQIRFLTQENPNTWRASKLMGVNIYGSNNEKIGDISEVLIDSSGQVEGVVIGVGGFLGIGEKNVALPFNEIEWMSADQQRLASGQAPAGSGVAGASGSMTQTSNDTTGTVAGRSSGTSATRGYPDHGVLRMTKADLQNAPNFRWPDSWTR